jgi:hypothetical protein
MKRSSIATKDLEEIQDTFNNKIRPLKLEIRNLFFLYIPLIFNLPRLLDEKGEVYLLKF